MRDAKSDAQRPPHTRASIYTSKSKSRLLMASANAKLQLASALWPERSASGSAMVYLSLLPNYLAFSDRCSNSHSLGQFSRRTSIRSQWPRYRSRPLIIVCAYERWICCANAYTATDTLAGVMASSAPGPLMLILTLEILPHPLLHSTNRSKHTHTG